MAVSLHPMVLIGHTVVLGEEQERSGTVKADDDTDSVHNLYKAVATHHPL